MSRREPVVAVFVTVALVWGFGSALAVEAAGCSPLVAPASAVLLLAAFGWLRRGRDVVDVIAPALLVSYAAYVSLALGRLSQPNLVALEWRFPPLAEHLPAVLVAGIPFALILTIFVAVPASLLRPRRRPTPPPNERFWAFVSEQNARARAAPPQVRERAD